MYTDAVAGLQAILPAITGIRHVQNGEPTKAHTTPLLYTLFAGFARNQAGQITANHYTVMLRLAIPVPPSPVDDTEPLQIVEAQLAPFVNRIPAAIDANPTLGYKDDDPTHGPRCNIATVTEARSGEDEGFIAIGGVLCRCITFMIDVVEKKPFRSGI